MGKYRVRSARRRVAGRRLEASSRASRALDGVAESSRSA
jgi:hypothetical protein